MSTQRAAVTALIGVVVVLSVCLLAWPERMSYAPFVPVVVAAGLFLHAVQMYAVFAVSAGALLLTSVTAHDRPTSPTLVAALVVVMLLLVAVDRRRAHLGISPVAGATMLVDLRDRLRDLGRLPADLPAGWHAESSIQPAFGDAFSGDFLVANRGTDRLDLALVDVSGKGMEAGTRSLMLSSAFAGLLDATTPAGFLPAANSYLLRQHWSEGFATAVHVSVDLATGTYDVGSAGHPSALHYHAGSGRWAPVDGADGVLLGVLEPEFAAYDRAHGRLERGDALLLYTDGVVEDRDGITRGIDRMLGAADRAVGAGPGVADRICATAMSGESDDRAVVVLWRD
ncbi:PP2C family protein-serine/threonine phosphatase [Luteipulveratus sp. YIM 133132]|uniref:PP2C family protein-serine/threonine phosphatase n=1 Tax=Luteipulveratus flavus TaxID=3031728 RepID=UPI0023B0438B|nr:PP2C family protein-serine/threonine phosphatase [Luteipulveratus sp. YIM 133132]MDE9366281.1 PP2C family protein-serine/threonine phosphatase [Luteipulveratus sp. YIM 133132]